METNWSIDRTKKEHKIEYKKIDEKIPDIVSQMVVEEILANVGGFDWNDPINVVNTISEMMSIDLTIPIENQFPYPSNIDRTILTQSNKDKTVPFWICQSIIRVDEKSNNRYIEYKGSKFNKIDIVFNSVYFKDFMNKVADLADCTWNVRWGGSKKEEFKLHRKTRPDATEKNETWLDKCVKPILTPEDTDGINIKNLIMVEFRRKN
jgi:hypothetical protein